MLGVAPVSLSVLSLWLPRKVPAAPKEDESCLGEARQGSPRGLSLWAFKLPLVCPFPRCASWPPRTSRENSYLARTLKESEGRGELLQSE